MSDASRFALLLTAVALAGLAPRPAGAAGFPDAASQASARRGAAYLASQQAEDGAVPDDASAPDTADVLLALVAGGEHEAVERALGNLEHTAARDASNGPYAGKVVSALVVSGEDPRDFAGVDFMARIAAAYNQVTGSYGGGNVYANTLAMAAWVAGGEDLPAGAAAYLRQKQCLDGAWNFSGTCPNDGSRDTDTTAMAMSILRVVDGPDGVAVRSARSWLLANQNASGCWGANPAADGAAAEDSSNSCGLVISAIVALGENPNAAPWNEGTRNPAAALRSLQQDSGAFYSQAAVPGAVIYATAQAVPALAGWSYPVSPPADHEPAPPTSAPGRPDEGTTPTTAAAQRRNGPTGHGTEEEGSNPPASADSTGPEGSGGEPGEATTTSVLRPPVLTTTTLPSSLQALSDLIEFLPPARKPTLRSPGGSVRVTIAPDPSRPDMGVATGVAAGGLGTVTTGMGWYLRRRLARPALHLLKSLPRS